MLFIISQIPANMLDSLGNMGAVGLLIGYLLYQSNKKEKREDAERLRQEAIDTAERAKRDAEETTRAAAEQAEKVTLIEKIDAAREDHLATLKDVVTDSNNLISINNETNKQTQVVLTEIQKTLLKCDTSLQANSEFCKTATVELRKSREARKISDSQIINREAV